MRSVEVTIAYGSETPTAHPAKRARVDLIAASGSHAATETVSLLRRRLRVLNLILAGIFLIAVLGADTPYIVFSGREVTAFNWILAVEHALIVVVSGTLAYLLGSKAPLSQRQLRWMELLTLAPVVATVATDQLWSMLNLPLIEAWNLVQSTYASGWSSYWVLLIIIHSTLVPNTWRRCAAIAITLSLIPLALTVAVEAHRGWTTPVVPFTMFLVVMAASLGCVIPAIVYNVHRHELLRNEAQEARQFGQYRLGRRLGAGGMGEVYLAEHLLLRRPCAIKLIRREYAGDPKNLIRFEREVQATATLTHPNTIQIFDYGNTQDGTFYYVMEYLQGLTLDELVHTHGPLPPARAVYLLRQVCLALREAHAIGLIHRDIKPSNVIACERGRMQDVAKLLDFGLVRGPTDGASEGSLTQEGVITGTPAYMSPEQAAGRGAVDERSDIYSLGALAYFLLTGQPPFANRSTVQILAAHLYEPPAPLTSHRPDVPADLQSVVLRCLAKNSAERYPDALSLEKALACCAGVGSWSEQEAVRWWNTHPGPRERNEPVASR